MTCRILPFQDGINNRSSASNS